MAGDGDLVEVVEARAAQVPVGDVEARRLDDLDGGPEAGGQAQEGAGVLRNVGLVEGEAEHRRRLMRSGRVRAASPPGWQPVKAA